MDVKVSIRARVPLREARVVEIAVLVSTHTAASLMAYARRRKHHCAAGSGDETVDWLLAKRGLSPGKSHGLEEGTGDRAIQRAMRRRTKSVPRLG